MTINKDIENIIYSIFDAFKAGNTKAIEDHLHEQATVWDIFTPELINGKHELEAFHQRDQEQKTARGQLTINIAQPIIKVTGPLAIALYYLDFSYQEPNPISGKVRITDVFILEDNEWKITHHHEGIVPEKNA
jgi:ketosteroid isomerase-like protein